jgi:positive regulator of sigma E activity
MKRTILVLPRILAILFIVFFTIFALDVFDQDRWFVALLMHLIPAFTLLVLTIVAWSHEKIGGILFLLAGIVMAFFFHSPTIASPAFLIGGLFLVDSYIRHSK